MIKYENYRMRILEVTYKEIDFETEEILATTIYKIQEKYPLSFGWHYINIPENEPYFCPGFYGFYTLDKAKEYMKKRIQSWKDSLSIYEQDELDKKLLKKMKRKHRKELKTTKKVVCEYNLLNFDK